MNDRRKTLVLPDEIVPCSVEHPVNFLGSLRVMGFVYLKGSTCLLTEFVGVKLRRTCYTRNL